MSFQALGPGAPVTTLLFGINVALYILSGMQSKDMGSIGAEALLSLGASQRELLWEGDWMRLIAPNFLHGNLIHIIFNMSALLSYGPVQERLFGSSNFASLYLLSGISGFCCSQIIGGSFSVGASGALFGLFGAEIALLLMDLPVWKYAFRNRELRNRVFLLAFLIGLGFLGSLLGSGAFGMGRWDNWCHLGGAVAGFVFGLLFESWRRKNRLNPVLVALPFAAVVLLIVAARWSVFNPYYHVHRGAVALSEKRGSEAESHFAEGRIWAARWGIQKRVARVESAFKAGELSVDDARRGGYRAIDARAAELTR